jgi:hypothetical protein
MANLYPSGAQALSVSNGATSFTISGILLDLSDVLPGDELCVSGASAPIATVSSGGGTLSIPWQGTTVSSSTAWWIRRVSDQRYSGFYTAQQAAKAAQRLALALARGAIFPVKGEQNAPPGSPADGDTYLVGTSPTGAWASNPSSIARYTNGAWVFPPFLTGDCAANVATNILKVFNGTAWSNITDALTAGTLTGDLLIAYANAGGAVQENVSNTATGASANARRGMLTGTSNSYTIDILYDNAGSPYAQRVGGSAVPTVYDDYNSHVWRTNAGVEKARLNSSREYLPGAAGAGSLGNSSTHWGSAWVDSVNGIAPIFILATGQSNMRRLDTYSWSPPSNLLYWNWDQVDGHVGTAFAAPSNTIVNAGIAFAARVAQANPTRRVYLVQIGFGGRSIDQWKVGASAPDVYANITANMTPALAAAGVSKIDALMWWQGETPGATPATYVADFETLQTRFKGETWFPVETPVVVFGLMPQAIGGNAGQDYMNLQLQRCVAADPSNRIFVYPGWTTAGMWVDAYHPTPAGGYAIGLSAADQFLGRGGARPMAGDMTDYGNGHFYRTKRTVVNLNATEPLLFATPSSIVAHYAQADSVLNVHIFDAFNAGNNLQGRRAGGTNAAKTQVTTNSTLLILTGVGWFTGATDYSTAQVSITMATSEDWTSTARGTRIRFSTTTNGTTAQTGRWDVAHNGDIVPVADNTYNIGSASFRTKELFAGTGTINTSDATEKDWRGGLDEAELRVAMRLTQLMGVYRWKASVAAKGDAARLHVGVTVQAVAEAFKAEGLDPWRYAMCCSDTFDVLIDSGEKDEDGQPIMVATGEKQTRLGLRYDQLYAFVTAAALHQMQAINYRLAALEG